MKGFSPKRRALKVDVSQDREIYRLQARPCIFQPGNFTGWGSQGVKFKTTDIKANDINIHKCVNKHHQKLLAHSLSFRRFEKGAYPENLRTLYIVPLKLAFCFNRLCVCVSFHSMF